MPEPLPAGATGRPAVLTVVNPSGNRNRVPLDTLPFTIGRNAGNHLVLRDNRISRSHARILFDGDGYSIEDMKSRAGLFLNGQRVERSSLRNGDRIEFGHADSYKVTFSLQDEELNRILEQNQPPSGITVAGAGNLGKLRALVEVARALQSSLSTHDVLIAVVDAALAVTQTERGFLLLKRDNELAVEIARDRKGAPLGSLDLKVPMTLINRALRQRRELLSMSFDPIEEQGIRPDTSVANLELRSVVCVPLIRIRSSNPEETTSVTSNDTVGLLYMDSRIQNADLSHGNRELLQTLALEASTILENARLLEEERIKHRLEEELDIARQIQNGLLPSHLPTDGWFRAAGSSTPSHQVGGDYFDVKEIAPAVWSAVVADVSGKGVSSALLASLLQGAFLLSTDSPDQITRMMARVNLYLNERTKGEKYATVFYSTLDQSGRLQWCNAGHCAPLIVHPDGRLRTLQTTGLPLGMLEMATYEVEAIQMEPADKIVIYSDGISEAENPEGQFFGNDRLRALVRKHGGSTCSELHASILAGVEAWCEGAEQTDDVTLVVVDFRLAD